MKYTNSDVTAIILTGGAGKRLGGKEKGLLTLNNKYFMSYILSNLVSHTKTQILSTKIKSQKYHEFGKTLVSDKYAEFQGPLSGILSCKTYIETPLILTTPCDTPLIPDDLVNRLLDSFNSSGSKLSVVHDGSRIQNLFLLFDSSLLNDLQRYFDKGQRSVYDWINSHDPDKVDFSDCANRFVNINTEDDLKRLLSRVQTR